MAALSFSVVMRDQMFAFANELYPLLVSRSISCLVLDHLVEDQVCLVQLEASCLELLDYAVSTMCWEVGNDSPADLRELLHVFVYFLDVPD